MRIAASGDEIDGAIEGGAREICVGGGADHFGVKFVFIERFTAGAAHDVLGEAIEAADAKRLAVQCALLHGFLRGAAFEDFEAIAWRE